MNPLVNSRFAPAVTLLLLILVGCSAIHAQTTAFAYQGKLSDSGTPANGTYDLQFKLFDALAGGNQIGATVISGDGFIGGNVGIGTTTPSAGTRLDVNGPVLFRPGGSDFHGHVRIAPQIAGFLFWLTQVNGARLRDVARQHAMICSFTTSSEYQQRFSPVVLHSNVECSP